MIAIGVGCRRGASAEAIVTLVREALRSSSLQASGAEPDLTTIAGLFTLADKRGEPGLDVAARALGLPLAFLDRTVLALVAGEARSCSRRVEEMFGLPGIAETAALAGAGQGAVLLVPRMTSATVTCAVAGQPGTYSQAKQARMRP